MIKLRVWRVIMVAAFVLLISVVVPPAVRPRKPALSSDIKFIAAEGNKSMKTAQTRNNQEERKSVGSDLDSGREPVSVDRRNLGVQNPPGEHPRQQSPDDPNIAHGNERTVGQKAYESPHVSAAKQANIYWKHEDAYKLLMDEGNDILEGFALRSVIDAVCTEVLDYQERMMCKSRGLRMGHRFAYWQGKGLVSRNASNSLLDRAKRGQQTDTPPAEYSGIRISVVNGHVRSVDEWGFPNSEKREDILILFAALKTHGVIRPEFTFDVVLMYGTGCQQGAAGDVLGGLYPTTGQSYSEAECQLREPLDWSFPMWEPDPPSWEQLEKKLTWRGPLSSEAQFTLAHAAKNASQSSIDVDVRFTEFKKPCSTLAKKNGLDSGSQGDLCVPAPDVDQGRQVLNRYHLSLPERGVSLPVLLQFPGVVFYMAGKYKASWERELVPMRHVIPIDPIKIAASFKEKLAWVAENDAAANGISDTATDFWKRHASRASTFRDWGLYFGFLNTLYARDIAVHDLSDVMPSGSLDCSNIHLFSRRMKYISSYCIIEESL